jgi:SAM-dependent methyltransferase
MLTSAGIEFAICRYRWVLFNFLSWAFVHSLLMEDSFSITVNLVASLIIYLFTFRSIYLMSSIPKDLTQNTIRHYHEQAHEFWQGTKDHDVSQNIASLCRHMPDSSKTILDFGCGPGRDLLKWTELGYSAIGLDGAEEICQLARTNSGCEVWVQNFTQLALPQNYFGGIFANASLFHIPKKELHRVLLELNAALCSKGVLFCSNPRGPGIEEVSGLRYGNYMEQPGWDKVFRESGFEECEHYYRPTGRPRNEQPWLAMVWRKET